MSNLFFRDFYATPRRVADVVTLHWIPVESRENPHMLYRVEMENGEFHIVDQLNSELILHGPGQYIPAAPNCSIIDISDELEDGAQIQIIQRFPLVGWHISGDDFVTPVTATHVWPDEREWFLLLPDGTIFSSRFDNYESEEALILSFQQPGLNDNA